jgi:hypothetical protein
MENKNYKITVLKDNDDDTGQADASSQTKRSIRIDIKLPTNKPLKWLYTEGTPQWAVDAAIAIGYEVKKI